MVPPGTRSLTSSYPAAPGGGRGIGRADHSGREDLGGEDLEVVRGVPVVEELAALARGYRMNQQSQLIDQSSGEQLLYHGDRAGDEDAADAGSSLERGHRIG